MYPYIFVVYLSIRMDSKHQNQYKFKVGQIKMIQILSCHWYLIKNKNFREFGLIAFHNSKCSKSEVLHKLQVNNYLLPIILVIQHYMLWIYSDMVCTYFTFYLHFFIKIYLILSNASNIMYYV